MRAKMLVAVFAFVAIGAAGVIGYKTNRSRLSAGPKPVHVILIGASIGHDWHLSEWPARAQAPGFTAETIPAWQFDKTEALEEALLRPRQKFRPTRTYLKSLFEPGSKADIVILKECSSYFPGDLAAYKASLASWVRQIQERKLQVILATTVPVTRDRASRDSGKQEGLLEYNRWLRGYAQKNGIPVLDLEAALRADGESSYLRDEYTSGDGSHLNARAYAILDETLRATLNSTVRGAVHTAVTQARP